MGNYHFASDYMTSHAGHNLPAWPMRAACQEMTNRPAPSTQPASHMANTPAAAAATPPPAAAAAAESMATSRRLLVQEGLRQQAKHQLAAATESMPASRHAAGSNGQGQDLQLLVKLHKAAALMYNVTGDAVCFTLDMSGPGAASVGECGRLCARQVAQGGPHVAANSCRPLRWLGMHRMCASLEIMT
jgi:hypothetical protein